VCVVRGKNALSQEAYRVVGCFLLQADVSDEEEKDIDDVVLVADDKYSAQSLDKMLTLVAVLVEKSRIDRQLHLSARDMQALIGGGKVSSRVVNFPEI